MHTFASISAMIVIFEYLSRQSGSTSVLYYLAFGIHSWSLPSLIVVQYPLSPRLFFRFDQRLPGSGKPLIFFGLRTNGQAESKVPKDPTSSLERRFVLKDELELSSYGVSNIVPHFARGSLLLSCTFPHTPTRAIDAHSYRNSYRTRAGFNGSCLMVLLILRSQSKACNI